MQLIECVPNFSEGVNPEIITRIADAIKSVKGVKLLNVDPGQAANRTVMTFAGEPGAVIEAAFLAIKTAGELIDMRNQKGEHPRMGATDVCPLIPVAGITMQETAGYAEQLARRVGDELHIPVYLYEHSQPDKSRSNLSIIRAGEYEGFFKKIQLPQWKPNYGPAELDEKRGATVIGARDFLIAYNVNLNTADAGIAAAIAAEVRESGTKVRDESGQLLTIPGALKSVKAIGWYIKEYGAAQVSMNLTDITITPVHIAFDEVVKMAKKYDVEVTGSELIGMMPLQALLDAGAYFLNKESYKDNLTEQDLIALAVKEMGLVELAPFDFNERIIEYALKAAQ